MLVDALRAMPADGSARASSARTSRGRSCRRAGRACTTRRACSAPDLALLRRLLDAAPVRQVTLAPELPGAFELIDELVARGVTVSAGHTDATAAEAHLAFDRGVAHGHAPLQRDAPDRRRATRASRSPRSRAPTWPCR